MTASSWPRMGIEWQPDTEGVILTLTRPEQPNKQYDFKLSTISVRELRDDMEHAAFESRGYEKWDLLAMEIQERDCMAIGGDVFRVVSTLEQRDGWVLQFEEGDELVVDADRQLTIWRPIQ